MRTGIYTEAAAIFVGNRLAYNQSTHEILGISGSSWVCLTCSAAHDAIFNSNSLCMLTKGYEKCCCHSNSSRARKVLFVCTYQYTVSQ